MTDGLFSPARRPLTVGLVLTVTLVAFEALAVATIMPIVSRELGDFDLYGWVFSAFFLGALLGIVVAGGLIDRGGLAAPFIAGLGLFAIGLVVGGLAPSMPVLVAGRFLQGLGVGAIPPTGFVAIGRSLPESLRPRMFAIISTAWVLPGVVGPALAGVVAEQLHWRVVFLGLLPLIGIAAVMTLPAIAAVPPAVGAEPGEGRVASHARRRLPAAILVTSGAGLVLAGLTMGAPGPAIALVGVGLALGVPALRRLTPPGTLTAATGLPAAILLRGLLTFAFFAPDTYVPYMLQEYRGTSATVAGVVLTAATVAWTAGAWIQARWIGRVGARRLVRIGFVTVAAGIAGTAAVLAPSVPVALSVLTWGVTGLGMGLSYSPLSIVVLREATGSEEGTAASGLQLSDTIGTALGAGVAGAIVAAGSRSGAEPWVALAAAFGLGAVVAVVGWATGRQLRPGTAAPTAPIAPGPPGTGLPSSRLAE